jgi:hypothetical protein
MKAEKYADACAIKGNPPKTKNWHGWIDKMPPPPDALHVRGEVEVSNPGVEVFLLKKQPQGINPAIILLDLFLFQRPGLWPALVVNKPAVYEEVGPSLSYQTAEILYQNQGIASVPIEIIQ